MALLFKHLRECFMIVVKSVELLMMMIQHRSAQARSKTTTTTTKTKKNKIKKSTAHHKHFNSLKSAIIYHSIDAIVNKWFCVSCHYGSDTIAIAQKMDLVDYLRYLYK